MTTTWYLSGPMTGLDDYNFPAFAHAATTLRGIGMSILSPHESCINEKTGTWTDFLKHDIHVLAQDCDGIILLKGWTKSRGAQLELSVALKLGYSVRYFNEQTGELFDIS